MEKVWTQFYIENFVKGDNPRNDDYYIGEYVYYCGDLSNVDLRSDWRFKEVPKKRKEALFYRLLKEEELPFKPIN